MRVIKFRIWSVDFKKYLEDMQYPNGHSMLWIFASDGTTYHIETGFDGLEAIPLREKIGEIIIEQFTGLHDKNGVEIYEGDIMRFPPKNKWEETNYCCHEVFFHDGDANSDYNIGYSINRMHCKGAVCGGYIPSFKPKTTAQMEIIGNIHENPNLLQ